eukprot:TRINITY_DN16547_c0_g1_i1.p1 TRINITY_DN16547_c0_g1~~TRINITY_DN16547_c0_g1_i1.p1  ORF type:complete len:593 (+),score=2.62 TRINITY_DN16547_c0_g1_i1:47-1825(+)
MFRWNRRLSNVLNLSKRFQSSLPAREQMHFDVVAVGGGPASLSAAIRLKQLAIANEVDISICVVEKGAELGAHILSGNVFEPKALNELFPNWQELGAPLETKATDDKMMWIKEDGSSISFPHFLLPSELHNEGNYIISLSKLVRWLGEQAEALGVEIYPGFAADEVLYNEDGSVKGIATKDAGIAKDGTHKDTFERGIELIARQTLFGEGCRGSCSESVMKKLNLRENSQVQSYGLGVKEVWEIPTEKCKPGLIQHTVGYPLQDSINSDVFGGSFLYHMAPNLVLVGMVVGLDYKNTYLSPYKEFQRFKHHPEIAKHLEGGECISYGARCLNEGGYHAIPKLTFPGGALIGCSAGFLNAIKIKGSHTAMKSGMLAAEAMYPLLTSNGQENTVFNTGEINPNEKPIEAVEYEKSLYDSWVGKELKIVRNSHNAFHYGLAGFMLHTGFSSFISKGNEPWTLVNDTPDADKTLPASKCNKIDYPKPDGKLSFDLLTNLSRSGTSHDGNQPAHLRVKPECMHVPTEISIKEYDGPEQRFCPAGVYEYSEADENGNRNLMINAQNCVHCKCCSIKTPQQFINWTVPEGGGGPQYTVM